MTRLAVVTGAFGYIGSAVAGDLLRRGWRVKTLTNRRAPPGAEVVAAAPLRFDGEHLERELRGADVVVNTYWVRIPHGGVGFADAVENSRLLIEAARRAGVRRFVQVSVSNASPDSDLAYFAGKGRVEGILRESGLSRAIVRPTLVVGPPDILVSNIAWLLRRFPLFLLPGGGRYRLQPILLSETGRILAEAAESSAALEIDAAGPEILTFRDLVRLVARSIGKRRWIVGAPAWLSMAALKCVEPFVRDRILVREEYLGLSRDLLVSRALPLSSIPVGEWLLAHGDDLGRTWTNDLRRHFGEGRGDPVLAPAGAVRPPVGQHGRMLVLGITGRNCAGKDSVADLLERRGFERRSLSDCLREELRSLGRPVTREALIEMGRELRAAEGPAVLAERTKRALATDRAVVVSVRSPAEVASLRRLPRFVLLAVDAPRHLRYEREVARRREGGVGSFEEFRALEAREDSTDPNAQQLGAAIALADHTITNDGSREDLERRVLALLEELDG